MIKINNSAYFLLLLYKLDFYRQSRHFLHGPIYLQTQFPNFIYVNCQGGDRKKFSRFPIPFRESKLFQAEKSKKPVEMKTFPPISQFLKNDKGNT